MGGRYDRAVFGLISKKEIDRALNELTEAGASSEVMTAASLAAFCNFRKRGMAITPAKDTLEFECLVGWDARTPSPGFGYLSELAHVAVWARTVIASTRLPDGPYGDLLYRAIVGYGAVVDRVAKANFGTRPEVPSDEAIAQPEFEQWLDKITRRFGDALAGDPPGTWPGSFRELPELAARLGHKPTLIAALLDQPRLVDRVHTRAWRDSFHESDFVESLQDPDFAHWLFEAAEPI